MATHEKARELVAAHREFWAGNCDCREGKGRCARSRIDVCLMFADIPSSGSGKRRINKKAVEAILAEATEKHLVARPFRDETRTKVDGVCFCCDDCCYYFQKHEEERQRGRMEEATDFAACTHCGACVDVCHFGARRMEDDKLRVETDKCYGCGLCRDVCPEDCIAMSPRG